MTKVISEIVTKSQKSEAPSGMSQDLPRRFLVRLATDKEVGKEYIEAMLERMTRDSDRNGHPMETEIQHVEDVDAPSG